MGEGTVKEGTTSPNGHVRCDPRAADQLIALVYDRLRRLAGRYMRAERRGHTLRPTALVHEAYIRLVGIKKTDLEGKTHFYAIAAREMRRVLREYAQKAGAPIHGGDLRRVSLTDDLAVSPGPSLDFLVLDEFLERMERRSPRRSKVLELSAFAGMTEKEIASELSVSERTVRADLTVARARLSQALQRPARG